jgi:hypothetical protein
MAQVENHMRNTTLITTTCTAKTFKVKYIYIYYILKGRGLPCIHDTSYSSECTLITAKQEVAFVIAT